jgi:hypothetical protein
MTRTIAALAAIAAARAGVGGDDQDAAATHARAALPPGASSASTADVDQFLTAACALAPELTPADARALPQIPLWESAGVPGGGGGGGARVALGAPARAFYVVSDGADGGGVLASAAVAQAFAQQAAGAGCVFVRASERHVPLLRALRVRPLGDAAALRRFVLPRLAADARAARAGASGEAAAAAERVTAVVAALETHWARLRALPGVVAALAKIAWVPATGDPNDGGDW